jgi:hypothetical protein
MNMVIQASNHFTRIIPTTEIIEQYPELYWGKNGVGDRWAKKKFNYSVVFNKKTTRYSEHEDEIPEMLLKEFLETVKGNGIIGIFVHSVRSTVDPNRPIRPDISLQIKSESCVVCGTQQTVCDHKNDLYNDPRVLDMKTQTISDFQPLCNHCNLQKRQVCKREEQTHILYSAKKIKRYQKMPFEFPWEKKNWDKDDIHCKVDTYWYDPVEFDQKILGYVSYVLPVIHQLKRLNLC